MSAPPTAAGSLSARTPPLPPIGGASGGGLVALVVSAYGPLAFGVVSLLVVWALIVRPELSAARGNLEALRGVQTEMAVTAQTLGTTARVLERVADRLAERVGVPAAGGAK